MNEVLSPLTGNPNVLLLRSFQSSDLIKDWENDFKIDISHEFDTVDEFYLYRCIDTQLDFFLPVSLVGSNQLYENLQKFDWFYMPEKWEFNEAINDISDCKTVLEVGCGPGYFIEKVQQRIRGCKANGIELNNVTMKKLQQRHLPIEYVDLYELASRGEKYDAVCSFQVLEHVAQPRRFIFDMIELLKQGGKLIISIPNKESFLKYQYNLLDMPPHHMTRWSAYTLKHLENLFPLKLMHIRMEPLAEYHISGFVHSYIQLFGDRLRFIKKFNTESNIKKTVTFLRNSHLYRFLRGQSLYAIYKKL